MPDQTGNVDTVVAVATMRLVSRGKLIGSGLIGKRRAARSDGLELRLLLIG